MQCLKDLGFPSGKVIIAGKAYFSVLSDTDEWKLIRCKNNIQGSVKIQNCMSFTKNVNVFHFEQFHFFFM